MYKSKSKMSVNSISFNKNSGISNEQDLPIRGFIFACTNKSESECLSRLLFATDKIYGPVVIRIRKSDLLFLNNKNTDMLLGVFRAVSDGDFNIQLNAFEGKYPYQVKVEKIGEILYLPNAKIYP